MEKEEEVIELLSEQLEKFKKLPYARLKRFLGGRNAESCDVAAKSGTEYEVQVESAWVDEPEGKLFVSVSVYSKGWRSFLPVSGDFVMRPDGSLGEEG